MAQQAAFVSNKLAMKVIKNCNPERLYDILSEEREGVRKMRSVNKKFSGN